MYLRERGRREEEEEEREGGKTGREIEVQVRW